MSLKTRYKLYKEEKANPDFKKYIIENTKESRDERKDAINVKLCSGICTISGAFALYMGLANTYNTGDYTLINETIVTIGNLLAGYGIINNVMADTVIYDINKKIENEELQLKKYYR